MKEYYVVLVDEYGYSNNPTEFIPIGIIEKLCEDSVREVIAKFILAELNLDDDEGEEMLSEVVPNLIKNGRYHDVDAEMVFKICPTTLFYIK